MSASTFFSGRTLLVLLFVGGFCAAPMPARAQEMASYYETASLLGAPASTVREGLLGYANPAVPALTGNHLLAAWSTDGRQVFSVDDWGLFSSAGGAGGALVRHHQGPLQVTGAHVSLAGGAEEMAFGIGYQRYWGDATALGRYNRLTAGTIARPSRVLSIGVAGNVSLETPDREIVTSIGVRPFGHSRLTLFADAAWGEGEALASVPWSAGAAVEVVPGLDVRTRVFDTEAVSLGIRFEFGRFGVGTESGVAPGGGYGGQVTRIRGGAYTPSAMAEGAREGDEHVELSLRGALPYRESRFSNFFGDGETRFFEVLRAIEQAGTSSRVAGLAVDLSGLQVTPEKAWEVREAMEEAQDQGVKIVAVLEGGNMTTYHIASVADMIALAPQGALTLPGYALGRTFVKGTLNKFGLGVQEWRFFEYKSAFERFSRSEYSQADSLQRQLYVNDQYRLTRNDVLSSRAMTADSLDYYVDEMTVVTAAEARRGGLVDTLARWHDRGGLLEQVVGESTKSISTDRLHDVATATRAWGSRPEIAVVYGIGATQVAGGMATRGLSQRIRELSHNDDVAAVVFRVDSPGGSAVAAAQVAEAIRTCSNEKPVIVSQGQVAGSGGYWVSVHADTIVAGPNTVTGSIGVIGGWIYDDGFSRKTGLSNDVVQQGRRADLFQGLELPVVDQSIPTRRLKAEEMTRIEEVIRQGYDDFVATVAEGRDTTEAYVREIGEGRIYSGRAGKDVGLVDEIGGLFDSIALAHAATGLEPEEVVVREVNAVSGTIELGQFVPSPISTLANTLRSFSTSSPSASSNRVDTYIRLVLEHQPGPLVLLPPGTYFGEQ